MGNLQDVRLYCIFMNMIIYYRSALAPREGSLSFQPGEEKPQRDLTSVYKYLMGENKKTDPDSSQGCPMPGEATSTN